ncbi:MAG: Gfo/Idh/MocA family oxidoreductase [Clostridiales bacterium]|nr:Gfo/Idh/MocA family oxidoreductase [Clostridiales bacterium]
MRGKLRFGILGCGMVSVYHINAVLSNPDAELYGVCDSSFENTLKTAAVYGVKAYNNYKEMLDDELIDVVCVCTPSGFHAQNTLSALNAGKHVIIEKPMALNVEDADAIVSLSEKTGKIVSVISQLRFTDCYAAINSALQRGDFGKIILADISMKYHRSKEYYSGSSWRGTWKLDGGGALMNQGIHSIDLIISLLGNVNRTFAFCRTLSHKIEVEDTATAVLEFESGAVGSIQASTACFPGYSRRFEICGDKGSVVFSDENIISWDLPGEMPQVSHSYCSSSSDPRAIGNENHIKQINDIVAAIKEDRPPLIDAIQGRKPVSLICAMYQSSVTGKPVDIKM